MGFGLAVRPEPVEFDDCAVFFDQGQIAKRGLDGLEFHGVIVPSGCLKLNPELARKGAVFSPAPLPNCLG